MQDSACREYLSLKKKEFENIKYVVSTIPLLAYYDVNKPVTLSEDATTPLCQSQQNSPQIVKEARQ